jgi:hypothetical protein
MPSASRLLARVVPVLVILVVAALQLRRNPSSTPKVSPPSQAAPAPTSARVPGTNAALLIAAGAHESGVEVEAHGRVSRLLADDNQGSRHQRFLVRIGGRLTILVAHNRDLARRVPIQIGDSLALRGEYIWNERGGMVHWTHHDPAGRHEPGWIELKGRRYE